MKLPEITVRNPISTMMAFIAILVFGFLANRYLARDVFPDIELPTLTVITVYPGASAEDVEQQVTRPLESVLAGTEKLSTIRSFSRENVSFISLQFKWGTDIAESASNARDLMELVKNELPQDARSPFIMKINTSIMPVVILGINAEESYNGIERIIEDQIAGKLRKIEGVGTVMTIAQPTREISISVDPLMMKKYRLSMTQVAMALKTDNISIPGGNIKSGSNDISIRIPGDIGSIDQLQNIVIGGIGGSVVRLSDIATIDDGFKEKDEIARTKGKRSVALMVQKQSGTNTLEVYNRVMKALPEIKKGLPPDVNIDEVFNTSEVINESLDNLGGTIWMGGIWVIVVVLIFLRKIRTSLIIALTIPFSLIASFIMMYVMGYTINVFSLMSLVIAIGMVVDNAIVVLENITRHIENGAKPKQAAIFGTSEMGMAITASTFTTIAVLFPLIFAGGIVGVLFEQLAVITTATLLASLVVSLTLTPMLASKLVKIEKKSIKPNRLFQMSEKFFIAVDNGYKHLLVRVLHFRWVTIASAVIIFSGSMLLIPNMGTDYIPEIDAGDVIAVLRTQEGTSAEETERVAIMVEKIFNEEVPEIRFGFTVAGQTEKGILSSIGFSEGKNIATIAFHLCPPDERDRSAKEIAAIITKRIEAIPEIEEFHVSGGSILASAMLGNVKPIEVIISGNDLDQLSVLAIAIEDSLRSFSFLQNIDNSADLGKPEYHIIIDKDKASSYGLNTAMIALQVRQSIYGANAGSFKESGKNYDIVVRYNEDLRNDPSKIGDILLSTLSGLQIPLSEVASVVPGSGPLEIKHENQERMVKVTADLNNISLGQASERVQSMISRLDHDASISVELGGQTVEQKESFGNMSVIFLIGIMLVFMIMAAQFESLKNPFIIIFAIPFTIVGVLWAFLFTGLTLSIVTFVGLIMLIGIVVNNGIVLVDYTNLLVARGLKIDDAISEAGRSRLRPVLMTTLTTILGMIPMAVSKGLGAEIWSPLGITMIGGLAFSTLVTLLLIPVLYSLFNRKKCTV